VPQLEKISIHKNFKMFNCTNIEKKNYHKTALIIDCQPKFESDRLTRKQFNNSDLWLISSLVYYIYIHVVYYRYIYTCYPYPTNIPTNNSRRPQIIIIIINNILRSRFFITNIFFSVTTPGPR